MRVILVLRFVLLLGLLSNLSHIVQAQKAKYDFLEPADSLDRTRFWISAGGGALIYSGFAYGLYQTWYKEFELTGFHTFDDMGEWNQMDKFGHLFTTYTETRLLYGGARWTGLNPSQSRWTAAAIASFLQATIEVMDGFSAKWGFSWSDIGFNTLGAATFVAQDIAWGEQRILLKVSSELAPYPNPSILSTNGESSIMLADRSRELYGRSFAERFLKDYNGMTIWASVNLHSFYPKSKWPEYLNLAVGHGAGNLYGGFANSWTDEDGNKFVLDQSLFPRHRQFYLSPDIDLTRIPTKKRWIKTALSVLNFVKIPAPALEYNTQGYWRWHWLYF